MRDDSDAPLTWAEMAKNARQTAIELGVDPDEYVESVRQQVTNLETVGLVSEKQRSATEAFIASARGELPIIDRQAKPSCQYLPQVSPAASYAKN